VRRPDYQWATAERVGNADTHLISTDARVHDLAQRLIREL
jgi:hypothetical protein